MFRFLTLDDVLVVGRLVLLRVDINVPIDVGTGEILDDTRIRAILPTLEELSEARVVILAHQSRPGYNDFTSLEPHYYVLKDLRGDNVYYVPDIIGPEARRRIEKLKPGDVLLLDNVRLLSEEVLEMPPEKAAKTIFVRRLAPLFNIYVNDAFPTAHRSQPSLVGFPEVLPAVAGRLMEKELTAINKALFSSESPRVFVIGGGKVKTKLRAALYLLQEDKADKILFGGAVANALLAEKGYFKLEIDSDVRDLAKAVLDYEDKIVLPVDGAIEVHGERVEKPIEELKEPPLDIGPSTIELFEPYIEEARILVANGPMGVFEKPGFDRGTRRLVEIMAASKAYKLIGGGHLGTLIKMMGVEEKFDRISTGGGALLYALTGRPLPAVLALERYYKKFHGFTAAPR